MRYTLQRGGHVELGAEELIMDQAYLWRQRTYSSGDRLGYEKRMPDDWFRTRFVEHRPPR